MSDLAVLVADPDEDRREATVAALRSRLGGECTGCGTVAAVVDLVQGRAVDCVVVESEFPDGTGIDIAAAVREHAPDTAVVLFTGAKPAEIDTASAKSEAVEYLPRDRSAAVDRLVELVGAVEMHRVQVSYPLPDDEDSRLAALDALDASRLDDVFDSLTPLVADSLGVPRASINLVGDHTQEFLACHGADWSSIPREESICTFTITGNRRVMTVPDTHEDPRFERIDALDELGIRAYMGVALSIDGGHSPGTLCVYDDEPREFSADDRDTLRRFADVVEDVVELYGGRQWVGATAAGER